MVSPRGVEIDLQDEGRPLDPDILEAAGRKWDFDPTDIQSLPVGGMGLMLIKKVMNEVSYRFENGRNRWRFSKFLPSGASVQSEATRTVNTPS
jgi:serine/threonine-protein kinase RsbW